MLPPPEPLGERLIAAIDLPGRVCDITASETSVWVTISGEDLVIEIDPATNTVVREFELGDQACTIAWADGSLWVGTYLDLIQQIERIDPLTGATLAIIDFRLASSIFAMDAGPGGLWVLNRQRMEVYRVDTATSQIAETFDVGFGASDMAVTDEAVWVTSDVSGGLLRIDVETGRVSEAPVDVPSGVAVDERGVWGYSPVIGQLTLIDPHSLEELVALRYEGETGQPATAAGAVWMPSPEGFLVAFHSGTAQPGALFVIPEGLDAAKAALDDLWLYGNVPGVLRVEPGDIQPAEQAWRGGRPG